MKRTLQIIDHHDPLLRSALREISDFFPSRFGGENAFRLRFTRDNEGARRGWRLVVSPEGELHLSYGRLSDALRALGGLMGILEAGQEPAATREQPSLETVGVMLDLSRNAVPRVATLKQLFRHFALMGINQVFLYMEDVYEIPGEPLFGYFRGRYSADELRQVDDYANLLGIEIVPFIQTLGHFRQVLQWPAYSDIQDTADVLLAGSSEAEALIEKMIVAAAAPFRSKRIHLGMDEAHGLGTGHHRLKNGFVPPFEILRDHLQRIAEICGRLELAPMIWSDMFFRLGSATGDYYDRASVIPDDIGKTIPANIDLVYWDYYHLQPDFYSEWIKRHRAIGREPIFAAGAWTWNRFWTALPRSFATMRAGMAAAREAGLKEAFVATWGDDGAECDVFSALVAVQYFADLAYSPETMADQFPQRFLGACDASAETWIAASRIDYYPGLGDPAVAIMNSGKWLLWHDPLLNFLERHVAPELPQHYETLAAELGAAVAAGDRRLEFLWRLATVLTRKTRLHLGLRSAYRDRNTAILEQWMREEIPALEKGIRALWQCHRANWIHENKPFGWDTLERRYGGLLLRLETLRDRLAAHLGEARARIEELESEAHPVYSPATFSENVINHRKASCPSMIC